MGELTKIGLTLAIALIVSALLVPVSMRAGTRWGLTSRPRLFGSSERLIPNIGGLAVAIAAAVAFCAMWGPSSGMGVVAVGGLLAVALGLADDRIKAFQNLVHHRLALQVSIAVAACAAGLRADAPGLLGVVVTVVILVASMNAFNLLDNMDGVAGSTGAAVGAGIAALAALQGQYIVASLAAAVSGACLGFLPYNLRTARVYLGNGGSLLLGFLLAGAALKLRLPVDQPWNGLAIIALLGVPATDTAVVIISRLLHNRPVMSGGVDHLSHRLVRLGFTSSQAALTHGAAGLIAAALVASGLVLWPVQSLAVPVILFTVVVVAMQAVRVYEPSALQVEFHSSRRPTLAATPVEVPVHPS